MFSDFYPPCLSAVFVFVGGKTFCQAVAGIWQKLVHSGTLTKSFNRAYSESFVIPLHFFGLVPVVASAAIERFGAWKPFAIHMCTIDHCFSNRHIYFFFPFQKRSTQTVTVSKGSAWIHPLYCPDAYGSR